MKSILKQVPLALAAALLGTAVSAAAEDVGSEKIADLEKAGKIKPFSEINAIVMKLYPGGRIVDSDLEHDDGKMVYSLDVHGSDGLLWDVEIDAATGEVLENRAADTED